MPPKKKQKAAARAPADKPPQQQSTRPHRTLQTPFQHTDDTLYTVEKITAVRWSGGARQWLVRWQGYGEQDDTWEPIEHLVGCATFIRDALRSFVAAPAPSLGSFQDFMTGLAHLNSSVPATSTVTEPSVKSEAELYLEMPAPPMHEDVLKWWASNETKFPALSVMARQYLGVPATSASAERLFSVAGRTYDDLRQNLKDEMLETTMWARINREKRHGNRSV